MSEKISNDPFVAVNEVERIEPSYQETESSKVNEVKVSEVGQMQEELNPTEPDPIYDNDEIKEKESLFTKGKPKRKLDRKQFFLKQSYRSQYLLLALGVVAFAMYSWPGMFISMLFDPAQLKEAPELLQGKSLEKGVSWIGLLILLFCLLRILVERILYKYEIKEKVIRTHKGIIAKKRSTVQFRHVNSVEVNKSIIGTLMNFGDVELYTASTDGSEILLKGVHNPDEVAKVLGKRLDHEH